MSGDTAGTRPNLPANFAILKSPNIPLIGPDLASHWARLRIDIGVLDNLQRLSNVTPPSTRIFENLQAISQIVEANTASLARFQLSIDAALRLSTVPPWTVVWSQLVEGLDLSIWSWEPPNWPEEWEMSDEEYAVMNTILNDDGIPLIWVPRREIVRSLFAATCRADRVAVLLRRRGDIVVDCREVVDDLRRSGRDTTLASEALAAFAGGFHHAAQALAVNVLDHAVVPHIGKHKDVPTKVKIDVLDEGVGLLRLSASLAPLGRAWAPWTPSLGGLVPQDLSRHVTVHGGDPAHYTEQNSLLAQMLMTSVLRGLADWEDRDGREAA